MLMRKRKTNDIYDNQEIDSILIEIKNLLQEKNIEINENYFEEGKKKEINIELVNKLDNNIIGKINGGIGEFKIIENNN